MIALQDKYVFGYPGRSGRYKEIKVETREEKEFREANEKNGA